MTKEQIVEQSNSYKYKLNDCNIHIDRCQESIESCNKIAKYFQHKTPEKQKLSKTFLFLGVSTLPLSILCLFTTPILGAVLTIGSFVCLERFLFFKHVTKRFKQCETFFTKITNSLTEKQTNFVNQKEHALKQIYKLENEIPEEIIETIAMIKDKDIAKLKDNTIIDLQIENDIEEIRNI